MTLRSLAYLFLPIALSLFAFESTKGLAMRYIQQTLSILAWSIGFTVVDLVGYALLTSVISAVSASALAVGVATKFTPATLVIGGIVAVWLILGSLVTPIVMQMLFCSGTPMSSAMGQAIQMGLAFAGASKLLPSGGGEGTPAPAGSPSSSSGGTNGSPPPSASAPPTASPSVPLLGGGSGLSPVSSAPLSPLPADSNGLMRRVDH